MGDFAATCAASDLPIPGGTPIRVLLLTQSPYVADEGDSWDLRAPPIRATYNSYGGIEDINPEDACILQMWLNALEVDLVERGVGDNQVHDLATRKGMTVEALCDALSEGRVLVRQDVKNFWHPERPEPDDPEKFSILKLVEAGRRKEDWRANMANVEAVLGEELVAKLNIDEPLGNVVRVRQAGFTSETDALVAARLKLDEHFAVAIVAGSGSYGFTDELLVMAKPGKDRPFAGPVWDRRSDEKHLPLAWAFVREDVWQALIAVKRPSYWGPGTVEHEREQIGKAWAGIQDQVTKRQSMVERMLGEPGTKTREQLHFSDVTYHVKDQVPFKSVPGVIGIVEHLAMMALDEKTNEDDHTVVINALGELAHVTAMLRDGRRVWAPFNCLRGAQYAEWKEQLRYLTAIKKVAMAAKKAEPKGHC